MTRAAAIGAASAGGLAFLAAGLRMEAHGIELARFVILGVALGAIVATDLSDHRIPNSIVAPAAVACAGLLAAEVVSPRELLGGFAVVAVMLALSVASPASFGMGDVKLALLVVLGLGGLASQALLLGLVLAAVFGAGLLLQHGRIAATWSLPLAPFLSSGAAAAMFI